MLRLFSSGHLAMFPIVVASGTIAGTAPVDGPQGTMFQLGFTDSASIYAIDSYRFRGNVRNVEYIWRIRNVRFQKLFQSNQCYFFHCVLHLIKRLKLRISNLLLYFICQVLSVCFC